jgi:hypothetical protein
MSRHEIVEAIERIYRVRTIAQQRGDFCALMIADSVGMQIVGLAQTPEGINLFVPDAGLDIGLRVAVETGKLLFKNRTDLDAYANWLGRALTKSEPDLLIMGEVRGYRIAVEQQKLDGSEFLAIRIVRP